jgi:hypothetical protein
MRLRDRLLFAVLLVVDKLFGTQLAQQEVNRRQAIVAGYQRQAAGLQQEIEHLDAELTALHLRFCLLYLRQRHMADLENWLRFESGNSDEAGLDLLIKHLVRPRLAAIETHETTPGHHVYHLRPDWRAIAAAIGDTVETLEPETIAWLHQQVGN